jgi:hypothetical protein
MTDRTAAERQARKAACDRAAGLIRRTVVIPADRAGELQEIARQWREQATTHPDVAKA